MIFAETNIVQQEEASFTKWGQVNKYEYDNYDGVFEWATYGWARADGYFEDQNELFRLTVNDDPVGDVEYLGDRSLVVFITKESGKEYIYFSVYNYGF